MHRTRALKQISEMLKGRMPAAPDWISVLTLASKALIAPAIYTRIEREALPEDVRAYLQDVRERNAARNAALMSSLGDAGRALNSADIEPVLLKGAALMALAGEAASDRMMCDVDVLVRAAEFELAVDAMCAAGFKIVEDKRKLARHPVVALARDGDRGAIDLHQRPPGGEIVSDLHASCRSSTLSGVRVKVPAAELQLLIGVWHDQWHEGRFWRGGFDLRHLIDAALLADAAEGLDWGWIEALAGAPKLAVQTQLLAARRIAGAKVPDKVLGGVAAELMYRRQLLQFLWPAVNAPLGATGLSRPAWRALSRMATRRGRRLGPA